MSAPTPPRWTKGPWAHALKQSREGYGLVVDQHGVEVALTTRANIDEDSANAFLIASAPDPYEALEKIVNNRGLKAGTTSEQIALDLQLHKARAALARARGEGSK